MLANLIEYPLLSNQEKNMYGHMIQNDTLQKSSGLAAMRADAA